MLYSFYVFCCSFYGDPRDLPVLTHSFPTRRSSDLCAAARALGADHAIIYKTQDFVAEVKAITGGAGVAAVLDMIGGDYVPRNLQCLADDGRHVSIAELGRASCRESVCQSV